MIKYKYMKLLSVRIKTKYASNLHTEIMTKSKYMKSFLNSAEYDPYGILCCDKKLIRKIGHILIKFAEPRKWKGPILNARVYSDL
jgi:hypothetical protein